MLRAALYRLACATGYTQEFHGTRAVRAKQHIGLTTKFHLTKSDALRQKGTRQNMESNVIIIIDNIFSIRGPQPVGEIHCCRCWKIELYTFSAAEYLDENSSLANL